MKRRIFLIAAIIWMAVIFFMSARDGTESAEDSGRVGRLIGTIFIRDFSSWDRASQDEFAEQISFPVRKAAHMTEYAILGFLLTGACDDRRKRRLLRAAGCAFLISFCYAGADEIHQIFIPDREGAFRDVLFDSAGNIIGILVYAAFHRAGRDAEK